MKKEDGKVKSLFSAKGRIGRLTLSLHLMGLYLTMGILSSFLVPLAITGEKAELLVSYFIWVAWVVFFYVWICSAVKRLHDLDEPGSSFWGLLIPILNIYYLGRLFIEKGTTGSNEYGDDPIFYELKKF